jgi:FkbM family methyltransferase
MAYSSSFRFRGYIHDPEREIKVYLENRDRTISEENFRIEIIDGLYNVCLYRGFMKMAYSSVGWFASFRAPLSEKVIIRVFLQQILVFQHCVFLDSDPADPFLDNLPFLHKYKNDNVDYSTFLEVFENRAYEDVGSDFGIEDGDVVVDIGSNIGAFIYYSEMKGAKKIYSCEPNPECFKILLRHFSRNKLVVLNEAAISEKDGVDFLSTLDEDLKSGKGFTDCSSSANYLRTLGGGVISKFEVPTLTFKNFISKNKINFVDFMKLDCEGGETSVLKEENSDYIKSKVRKIAVECHGNRNSIISFLKEVNFKLSERSLKDDCEIGVIHAKNSIFL